MSLSPSLHWAFHYFILRHFICYHYFHYHFFAAILYYAHYFSSSSFSCLLLHWLIIFTMPWHYFDCRCHDYFRRFSFRFFILRLLMMFTLSLLLFAFRHAIILLLYYLMPCWCRRWCWLWYVERWLLFISAIYFLFWCRCWLLLSLSLMPRLFRCWWLRFIIDAVSMRCWWCHWCHLRWLFSIFFFLRRWFSIILCWLRRLFFFFFFILLFDDDASSFFFLPSFSILTWLFSFFHFHHFLLSIIISSLSRPSFSFTIYWSFSLIASRYAFRHHYQLAWLLLWHYIYFFSHAVITITPSFLYSRVMSAYRRNMAAMLSESRWDRRCSGSGRT